MSSKASVRNYLEKKKQPKKKTTKSVKGGLVKSIEEVNVKTLKIDNTSKKGLLTIKKNKAVNYDKIAITFDTASRHLPINSWLEYELNKTFIDKKTREYKRIYCKSAFFKGAYDIRHYSKVDNKVVTEPMIILRAGSKNWHFSEKDIHQLRLIKCVDYINTDFAGIAAKNVGKKAKSLTHDKTDKADNATKNKLLRRPKSILH
jgi:hypothetical protein